jgi:hypothetical protein
MKEKEKDAAAVSLGKRGGKARVKKAGALGMSKMGRTGAKARAEALSPERRKEIARQASAARWGKAKAARKEDTPSPTVGSENLKI